MSDAWKPDGHSTVSPYLVVDGAQREVEFLQEVFGGEQLRRYEAEDGSLIHVEVRIGDTVVMLGDAGEQWPALRSFIHVYVEDVDAVHRRGVEAGGVSVEEPSHREGDPDRRGGIRSPGGNTWWIATQVE